MTTLDTTRREYVLVIDDEPAITEALALSLDRPGRTTIVCSDLDAAEIALASHPVTHIVVDVQFSGAFGFEGLHFLGRIRARQAHCRTIVITGSATGALRTAARDAGAAAVLAKPFDISALEETLASTDRHAAGADNSSYEVIRIPSIDDIVRGDALAAVFQPIVRLTDGGSGVFGFEALTRVRGNSLAGGPAALFDYAERRSRLTDLNIAAMSRAIEDAATLPHSAAIFINLDPVAFESRALVPALFAATRRASLSPSRLVLEITERSGLTENAAISPFDELRRAGVRFAFDDHGSAYSHLSAIGRILPSFIKISHSFGTDFQSDVTKERIVRHLISLANDLGCEAIVEGIESAATAQAAARAGATLVQGFHFGRPREASHWVAPRRGLDAA